MRVEPVVFSQGSRERTKDGQFTFANMRSELWWQFREALDPVQRRRHRAAAGPPARGAARRADLDAARQRDRDREQGRDPQAARHVDRRCRRGDPRLAQARRRAAAADAAAARIPGGRRRMDGRVTFADETHASLMPAEAGIQPLAKRWVPAFAGTSGTTVDSVWLETAPASANHRGVARWTSESRESGHSRPKCWP